MIPLSMYHKWEDILILYVAQPTKHHIRPNVHFEVEAPMINILSIWEPQCAWKNIYTKSKSKKSTRRLMHLCSWTFTICDLNMSWSFFEDYSGYIKPHPRPSPPPSWVCCALIGFFFLSQPMSCNVIFKITLLLISILTYIDLCN